jgi:hypothetical protein
MKRLASILLAAPLLLGPAAAQIRNAPSPRAVELAAYIFAVTNVCGWRLDPDTFEALMKRQNVTVDDVSPRGPFGNRVSGQFALMSNQMAQNRAVACDAAWREFGDEGVVSKGLARLPPAQ